MVVIKMWLTNLTVNIGFFCALFLRFCCRIFYLYYFWVDTYFPKVIPNIWLKKQCVNIGLWHFFQQFFFLQNISQICEIFVKGLRCIVSSPRFIPHWSDLHWRGASTFRGHGIRTETNENEQHPSLRFWIPTVQIWYENILTSVGLYRIFWPQFARNVC